MKTNKRKRAAEWKRMRRKLGCTQSVLAFALNMHPMTISKIERGVLKAEEPWNLLSMAIAKGATARYLYDTFRKKLEVS